MAAAGDLNWVFRPLPHSRYFFLFKNNISFPETWTLSELLMKVSSALISLVASRYNYYNDNDHNRDDDDAVSRGRLPQDVLCQ